MRAAIGRRIDRRVSFPISASDVRRWAIAVYWPDEPPSCYWDGGTIPEEFNPFAWMTAEPRGVYRAPTVDVEAALGIAGPNLATGLNGGLDVEYRSALHVGDVVTSVRTLKCYRERQGSRGHMLFTTVEDVWTNQSGDIVQVRRITTIRY
jgi:hypothetical protein